MNCTLKGCKRRASPVYLLIWSAIFKTCWHPYQGVWGFGFGFRGYRCAQPPVKGWHPFDMRQQHKKSKGPGLFFAYHHPFHFPLWKNLWVRVRNAVHGLWIHTSIISRLLLFQLWPSLRLRHPRWKAVVHSSFSSLLGFPPTREWRRGNGNDFLINNQG